MVQGKMISSKRVGFQENAVYWFRKDIFLEAPAGGSICISAEARYKLWINGQLAAIGPCKGSDREVYYDSVEIGGLLHKGKNEILVQVLQLTSGAYPDGHRFLCSVYRTGGMLLALWGSVREGEEELPLMSDKSWLCARDESLSFEVPQYAFYAGLNEKKQVGGVLCWEQARELGPALYREQEASLFYGETGTWFMSRRPIPMLELKPRELVQIQQDIWDAGALTTGMIRVRLSGAGTVRLIYGECFIHQRDGAEYKEKRDDPTGCILGDWDTIQCEGKMEFETFWFKTFRYIRAEIQGTVKVEALSYIDTCYPLTVQEGYSFGSETDDRLWEMSVRTLHRCMHETYEDCPYFEQLQYIYDTSLEMIYTYQITNDDRLARKLIRDFAQSYHFGSTVQSRFPSVSTQYIAEFPMFFIFMLDTHERRFGDREMVREYLHILDGILLWFEKHRDEAGLIRRTIYWEYIDWSDGWEENRGAPEGEGPLSVQNMMYISALECAARLNRLCGREGTAREYETTAERVRAAVERFCYDEERELYRDSRGGGTFSQHPQIWAVLTGLAEGARGKALLERSFQLSAQAAFGYTFLLARALERVGLYDRVDRILEDIRGLLSLGCTTIPETPAHSRSECHGWGAVALYEFTARVLGVQVISAWEKKLRVRPYCKGRTLAKGPVATPWGFVWINWRKDEGRFVLEVKIPDGIAAEVELPDGTKFQARGKKQFTCTIEA